LQSGLTLVRLHNEILDFYDWVAPQQYEHSARDKLVKRISDALGSQRWFPQDNGRILCFGSYPAGLYLPTADMDLVYASDRLYNGGPPVLESATDRAAFTRTLRKASQRLQKVGIANNPFVIAKARVPIIKFKDRLTGLDVDISFENLSGVQAQATFDQWKNEYPDMLYMVALVKQLLVMRGLNEVHTGGLGGFSIICLIVSYIQHAKKAENLGDCFLGFLKYYGKDFDLSRKRIQMNPPAVLNKVSSRCADTYHNFSTNLLQSTYGIDGREESDTGLSIQDPNKLDNNISGGSRRAAEAFNVFSAAHDTLADRLKASELGQEIGPSILACIIGGNYDSYLKQRHRLSTIP
jgi:non-canonical poly(A) RNA polymerase PAPD5/7